VYGIEEKDNKVSGYIEAQEGKQFVVRFADLRTTPPEDAYSSRAYVDGKQYVPSSQTCALELTRVDSCGGKTVRPLSTFFGRHVTSASRFLNFPGIRVSQVRPFAIPRCPS